MSYMNMFWKRGSRYWELSIQTRNRQCARFLSTAKEVQVKEYVLKVKELKLRKKFLMLKMVLMMTKIMRIT